LFVLVFTMSVHNSENGDDYIEDPGHVTLISKLDISDPLDLHPNDTTALTVVSINLIELKLSRENQHMTYTDKELDNVLDISHLRIKVGHPNGTETYISKIGNLSSSSISGSNHNTVDFPLDNPRNDADSIDEFVATQNEGVDILEENVFSEGNLDQNPSSSHGVQNVRRSSRQSVFSMNYNDLVVESKVRYGLEKYSDKGVFLALLVYVDDIINTGNSVSEIEKFKVLLESKFMIKDLGKLKYFLRIEVVDIDIGILLNETKYILDLLSEYGMLACKPAKTNLMSKLVISNEAYDNDPLLENVTDYQRLTGTLIYLTNTRPDISYAMHCLSQFMHSPLTSHLKIAFKILSVTSVNFEVSNRKQTYDN
nr:ribonuclease H-like domain-containing protein [Tanacetum cinerariifolium]